MLSSLGLGLSFSGSVPGCPHLQCLPVPGHPSRNASKPMPSSKHGSSVLMLRTVPKSLSLGSILAPATLLPHWAPERSSSGSTASPERASPAAGQVAASLPQQLAEGLALIDLSTQPPPLKQKFPFSACIHSLGAYFPGTPDLCLSYSPPQIPIPCLPNLEKFPTRLKAQLASSRKPALSLPGAANSQAVHFPGCPEPRGGMG